MTIIQKAEQVKDDPQQFEKFCRTLFTLGKDWLDVETLMTAVGKEDDGTICRIYEEWQFEE